MAVTTATLRRLPGFSFEARAPLTEEVLPRLDVAAFAGFAASGPVGVPVPVEDAAQFAAVFGEDATLAWDAERGEPARALLAPAVRSFFVNGGRRCWVVRLAGDARTNDHPVPGVAAISETGAVEPLALAARSPGSWSDDVSLSASLTSQRFGLLGWDHATGELDVAGPSDAPLRGGDLLRLTARDAGVVLYLGVDAVSARDAGQAAARRLRLRVRPGAARWFDLNRMPATRGGDAELATGTVAAWYESATTTTGAVRALVSIETALRDAPRAGEVIVARFGNDTLLLAVDDVALPPPGGSPPSGWVLVWGTPLWTRSGAPSAVPPLAQFGVERLGLELWARTPGGDTRRLEALGMAPGHPRHVELLPDDDAVYGGAPLAGDEPWTDALVPRFPVAGRQRMAGDVDLPDDRAAAARLCIPFGVGALPDHALAPRTGADSSLERDGLVPFDAALFGDAALAASLASTLLEDAEYIRHLAPVTRPVVGLHRTLAIEEATLIAVPDATQPGWVRAELAPLQPAEPSAAADAGPDEVGAFTDCGLVATGTPVLGAELHDTARTIALSWTVGDERGPFVVEEATTPDWRDAAVVYQGGGRSVTLESLRTGDHYYRVRGLGDRPTRWSNGLAVRVTGGGGWRVRTSDEYRDDVLVAVHRMLLRAGAARRDTLAVLSLPRHYRDAAAAAHVRLLTAPGAPDVAIGGGRVPGLGHGEADAFGFGALYHGWLHARDGAGLRAQPPDGAVCAAIARRGYERGAWVAPANEPLRGIVALARATPAARWQELQQLGVNVVRHEPRGFVVMSADTLARDEELRPIGVRRLLILLRRAAIRLGTTYVFEPSDDAFRRMVQRGFEAMLGDLFQRGAFAGSTPSRAFQVVTDPTVNTRQSLDLGRFVVELRVAPSHPLTFLTLRLVQTGERVTLTGA